MSELLPFRVGDPCPRCGAPVEGVELEQVENQWWKRAVYAVHRGTRCRVGALYTSPYGDSFRLRAAGRAAFLAGLQPYGLGARCPLCGKRIADVKVGWVRGCIYRVFAVHDPPRCRRCSLGYIILGVGWLPSLKLARKLGISVVPYRPLAGGRLWVPSELGRPAPTGAAGAP